MWSNEDLPQPACVAPGGVCPVVGCAEDGECYLWRCVNPHAPKPEEGETLPRGDDA